MTERRLDPDERDDSDRARAEREAEELEDRSLDPDELSGEPEWWARARTTRPPELPGRPLLDVTDVSALLATLNEERRAQRDLP